MFVDEGKLDEVLKYVKEEGLICPPPYDFGDDRFIGLDCPGVSCDKCWKKWLAKPNENRPI